MNTMSARHDTPPDCDGDGSQFPVSHVTTGIVSRIHEVMSRAAPRVWPFIPQTVCGSSLLGDPDRAGPQPYPISPICPDCCEILGVDAEVIVARSHWNPPHDGPKTDKDVAVRLGTALEAIHDYRRTKADAKIERRRARAERRRTQDRTTGRGRER